IAQKIIERMYSPSVASKACERAEELFKIKLTRHEPAHSLELTKYLLDRHAQGQLIDSNGNYLRKQDAAFIRNERLLCQHDFRYFTRYCQIIRDGSVGGGIGSLDLWESQKILLDMVGKLEETNIEQHAKYCFRDVDSCMCDGICVVDNKG